VLAVEIDDDDLGPAIRLADREKLDDLASRRIGCLPSDRSREIDKLVESLLEWHLVAAINVADLVKFDDDEVAAMERAEDPRIREQVVLVGGQAQIG
jgi:hypothetical protein